MLLPKVNITQDLNTGALVRNDDITGLYTAENPGGYGGPNPQITDVTKVRFLYSSYLTEQSATTVTECIASVEYEVIGSGSNMVVVDTKTYELGDIFILEIDATPVIGSGLQLVQTGRFATQTDFLPPDYYVEFTPGETGVDDLIFPDSAYHSTYETYTTPYLEGANFPANTYIVNGDPLGRIQIGSVEYNVGEVFTTDTTETFTDTTGTNSVCKFEARVTTNYPLFYYAWQDKIAIEQCYVTNPCKCKEVISFRLFQVQSRLDAIAYNYEDDLNNDDSGTQALLNEISEIAALRCNCQ